MFPTLEGIIARRILLNLRADPSVVRPLVPPSLELVTQHGNAIVGVCLIRLEQLRAKGVPAVIGVSSENMAHRVAIRFPTKNGMKDGVFIWRRETDQTMVTLLGGRLFPGVHFSAEFNVEETDDAISMSVKTKNAEADVVLRATKTQTWKPSSAFESFDEMSDFFRRGDCGFSCSLDAERLEGMQLRTLDWKVSPINVETVSANFFQTGTRFPADSVEFDCALWMRSVPHEWHLLSDVPEMAVAPSQT
jgi:hypothetical protein